MKWNFQVSSRNNNVVFPGLLIFGLAISKGSNTIMWNIQGLSFVLSGTFSVKVKKFQGIFKKVYPQPSLFGFFLEYPIN